MYNGGKRVKAKQIYNWHIFVDKHDFISLVNKRNKFNKRTHSSIMRTACLLSGGVRSSGGT